MAKITTKAAEAWRALNGILCVYKPREFKIDNVIEELRHNLCKELNQLEVRPPRLLPQKIETDENKIASLLEQHANLQLVQIYFIKV